MSLESNIAALVTAANNLTAAVNSKIGIIDEKVADAVASVPGSVKSYLENRTSYYVDSINGLDTNDGSSWVKAKKTLKAAITQVGVRRYASIYISKNTHVMSSSITVPDGSNIVIIGDPNSIVGDLVPADRDQYLIQRPDYAGGLPGTGDCLFLTGDNTYVGFRGVRINYGNVPHRPVHWSSFFKTTASARLDFLNCKVESRDGNNVANIELGNLSMTLRYSTFVALAGTDVGVLRGYSSSSYGFVGGYGNTLTNFVLNGSVPMQPA